MVCRADPRELHGVGRWYDDFSPVSDDEVLALLGGASAGPSPLGGSRAFSRQPLRLDVGGGVLDGDLTLPARPRGRAVRPWQRQQPPQPAQPGRGRVPQAGGVRRRCSSTCYPDEEAADAIRPAAVRHRLAAARLLLGRDGPAAEPHPATAGRVLWREHRQRRRLRAAAARRPDRPRRRLPRRPARPRRDACASDRADAADRRRHDFPVIELNRGAASSLDGREQAHRRPGRHHLFEEPERWSQVAQSEPPRGSPSTCRPARRRSPRPGAERDARPTCAAARRARGAAGTATRGPPADRRPAQARVLSRGQTPVALDRQAVETALADQALRGLATLGSCCSVPRPCTAHARRCRPGPQGQTVIAWHPNRRRCPTAGSRHRRSGSAPTYGCAGRQRAPRCTHERPEHPHQATGQRQLDGRAGRDADRAVLARGGP